MSTGRLVRARAASASGRVRTATASAPAASASAASAAMSPASTGTTEMPSPSEMAWLKRVIREGGRQLGSSRSPDAPRTRIEHREDVSRRPDPTRSLDGKLVGEPLSQELDVEDGRPVGAEPRRGLDEVRLGLLCDLAREARALLIELGGLDDDL